MTAKVCHIGVEAHDFGAVLCALARTTGATSPLALKSAQFTQPVFEGSGVIEFANHLSSGRDRGQSTHPHVDADGRVALGNTGLLGTSDTHPHGRTNALTLARDCDARYLGSIKRGELFDASGILVRAPSPENRQREVTPVGLEAHGASGKGESVPVLASFLETGKAHATARYFPRARPLPAPVGVGGALDRVRKNLFRDFAPPDLASLDLASGVVDTDSALLRVLALAQGVEGRGFPRLTGLAKILNVLLHLIEGPVESLVASPEGSCYLEFLLWRGIEGEGEGLDDLAIGGNVPTRRRLTLELLPALWPLGVCPPVRHRVEHGRRQHLSHVAYEVVVDFCVVSHKQSSSADSQRSSDILGAISGEAITMFNNDGRDSRVGQEPKELAALAIGTGTNPGHDPVNRVAVRCRPRGDPRDLAIGVLSLIG